MLAGVELGGTKCICVLGTGPHDIREQHELPTRDPAATLAGIEAVFDRWHAAPGAFEAIGIASFGPLDLLRDSPHYGRVACTPKPGWAGTELHGRFERRYALPVSIDTDVNGAALAERRWGGARGLADFAYVTVGTGIGAGLIVAGHTVFGANHTELGHIRVVRMPGDPFPGICPLHGDCLEGLASGPAIAARTGRDPGTLSAQDPVWDPVAHALAQLCHTLALTTGPRRIFFGGGVMLRQPHLFPRIRAMLQTSLNGYLATDEVGPGIERFIAPSGLGAQVGPLGALAVAADAVCRPG